MRSEAEKATEGIFSARLLARYDADQEKIALVYYNTRSRDECWVHDLTPDKARKLGETLISLAGVQEAPERKSWWNRGWKFRSGFKNAVRSLPKSTLSRRTGC